MPFSEKHLYNNEKIVEDLNPHWWYLAPTGALVVVATAAGVGLLALTGAGESGWETFARWLAAALIVGAAVAFVVKFIGWRSTNFVITTERCIGRSGVLKKSGIEIPLDRINTVFFNQTVFERMLRTGDIGIESAGEGSRQRFSDIANPLRIQNVIYQQMEENENRKYDRIGGEARQAAASVGPESASQEIERLANLLERGAITQAEFDAQKAQILGR